MLQIIKSKLNYNFTMNHSNMDYITIRIISLIIIIFAENTV